MKHNKIFWFLFFVTNIINLSAQNFNVSPKAYVGGMPGNAYNDVWGYVDKTGKEFAIIGSSRAINIYDVTDCSNPIQKMSHIDGSTVTWRDFKTYRNYAYGVCDGGPCTEGLEIINLDNYTVTQSTAVFDRAHNIYIDTLYARLYVVGSNATNGQITIYTLDTEIVNGVTYNGTPANPVLLRKFPTSYIHDIYVRNNIAYASHGYNGYIMWDVTNPANIQQLASNTDASGYNHSSWLTSNGQYAYAAEEVPRGRPLKLYQISGSGLSTSLNLISSFKEPLEAPAFSNNRPHNPFVKGDTLFVSYYEDGVQIFNIANPLSPKLIAYYDTYKLQNGLGYDIPDHDWKGPWGVYPYLPSGCILASDITQGLFTFKVNMPVSDNSNPGKVSLAKSADIIFEGNGKGLVLRSDKGYCFRLVVDVNGNLSTQRIVCHINNQQVISLEKNDLAFENASNGVILKDISGNCKKIKINSTGVLLTEALTCTNGNPQIKMQTSDLVIETFTKGLILKNTNGVCFRITVNNAGNLQVLPLTSCPL
jgi:choice-of-anchor B domain-containing protein